MIMNLNVVYKWTIKHFISIKQVTPLLITAVKQMSLQELQCAACGIISETTSANYRLSVFICQSSGGRLTERPGF